MVDLSRTGTVIRGVVPSSFEERQALVCVPRVATRGPWQFGGERGH